jgi:hypothetical protein
VTHSRNGKDARRSFNRPSGFLFWRTELRLFGTEAHLSYLYAKDGLCCFNIQIASQATTANAVTDNINGDAAGDLLRTRP